MNHSFNVELAEKFGVEKAILLQNIAFWIAKNIANNKNNYDGHYWTYNSGKAFGKLFPYIKEDKIIRHLKQLEKDGIILTGNYNKSKYDRTKWYTIINESILKMLILHYEEFKNGVLESSEPIPDSNTDNKTNDKTYIDSQDYPNVKITVDQFSKLIEDYGRENVLSQIEKLSNYMYSKGVKYKSHAHTLRSWFNKDGIKKINAKREVWTP